jgi:(2S)-methylsuccinyl-CoA dehydrogenase
MSVKQRHGYNALTPAGEENELSPDPTLRRADELVAAMQRLYEPALQAVRETTENGRRSDEFQVVIERIAYAATELRAAAALADYALSAQAAQPANALPQRMALAWAAEVAERLQMTLQGVCPGRELTCYDEAEIALIREGTAVETLTAIGREVIESGGSNNGWIEDEGVALARDGVRAFARAEVAGVAMRIHQNDELVSDELIDNMAHLGLFSASIPEEYGGSGLGYRSMVVATEELSNASLAAAGSLSTRPEILARALLAGGSERQRRYWLPRIASGELMVAIAVTEPDAGSDVAAVRTRATPAERGGVNGYAINGTKAWSTFAGRADILAVLARTDPSPASGSRGLSMFIVPKLPHYGHDFEERQPEGGALTGRAIQTPGYRGMHSYVLSFDDYFVPAENLVGEESGLNRGFYLQMAGFAAGRLQTGGRALGVAQAALTATVDYVRGRRQFGRPLSEYQLTQFKIGRMAVQIAAARQLTYSAASAMEAAEEGDGGTRKAADLLAALAKLLASDVAVEVTQEGQLLHGGWGYAEETPISRYVVDAQVLPIFEGAKAVLELRVIGASLLREA